MTNLSPTRSMKSVLKTLSTEEENAYNQMLSDDEWKNAKTFRQQCLIIKKYLRTETVNVSFERLGEMFGGKHCVEKQIKKIEREENDEMMKIGRPPLLSEMQTSQLIRLIQEMHERKYYPSYEEIRNIMEEDFKLILS